MPGSFFVPYSANAWEAVGPGVHGAFREHGVPPRPDDLADHACVAGIYRSSVCATFSGHPRGVSWASRLKEAPLCIDLLHNTPRTVLLRMLNV